MLHGAIQKILVARFLWTTVYIVLVITEGPRKWSETMDWRCLYSTTQRTECFGRPTQPGHRSVAWHDGYWRWLQF